MAAAVAAARMLEACSFSQARFSLSPAAAAADSESLRRAVRLASAAAQAWALALADACNPCHTSGSNQYTVRYILISSSILSTLAVKTVSRLPMSIINNTALGLQDSKQQQRATTVRILVTILATSQ